MGFAGPHRERTGPGGHPLNSDDLARLDARIAGTMDRWGVPTLRYALAIIFILFGILKPLGLSPAAPLVRDTVAFLPFGTPDTWVVVIGWWEVAIGVCFLWRGTIRVAIALLAAQMVGTFLPLVLLPEATFQAGRYPWAPTIEGQYIIKNLLIIAAAMVVGGTVRREGRSAQAPAESERD